MEEGEEVQDDRRGLPAVPPLRDNVQNRSATGGHNRSGGLSHGSGDSRFRDDGKFNRGGSDDRGRLQRDHTYSSSHAYRESDDRQYHPPYDMVRGDRDGGMQHQQQRVEDRRPERHHDSRDSRDRERPLPAHRDGGGYDERGYGERGYGGDWVGGEQQDLHHSHHPSSGIQSSRHSSFHSAYGEAAEESAFWSRQQQQGGGSDVASAAIAQRGRRDNHSFSDGGRSLLPSSHNAVPAPPPLVTSIPTPASKSTPPPEVKPAARAAEEAPLIKVISKDANIEIMSEREKVKNQKVFAASGSKERDRSSKKELPAVPAVATLTPPVAALKLPTANPFRTTGEFHPSPPLTDSSSHGVPAPVNSSSSALEGTSPTPVAGKRARAAWGQGLAVTKPALEPEPSQAQEQTGGSILTDDSAVMEGEAAEADNPRNVDASLPPAAAAEEKKEGEGEGETPKKRSRDQAVEEVLTPPSTSKEGSRTSPRSSSKQKEPKQAEASSPIGDDAKKLLIAEKAVAEKTEVKSAEDTKKESPRADASSNKKRSRTPTVDRRTEAETPSAVPASANSASTQRGRPFGSSNRSKSQRVEQPRKRDRALLSQVFSSYGDLGKAFNTIKAMIDMQQGIFMSNIESVSVIPASVGRVPLPLLSEISFSLDFVETQSDYLVENMLAVKSRQVILENMLARQKEGSLTARELSPASFLPFPDTLTLTNYAGYAVSVPPPAMRRNDAIVSTAADLQQTRSRQQQQVTVAPISCASAALLCSIQEQNKIRIVEAHLFAATANKVAAEKIAPTATNSSAATGTSGDAAAAPAASPAAPIQSITDLIKAAIMPSEPYERPRAPGESDSFARTAAKMKAIRLSTVNEIRHRKLAKRNAWEELANRYMWQHQRWTKHLEPIEKRQEAQDAEQPREALTLGQPPQTGRQTSNSASATGFGHGLASSRSSDRIRSEYDQDRLLKQLEQDEALNLRIAKGAATVVGQLLPWQHFDKTKVPPPPHWPEHLTEFTSPSGEVLSNVYEGSRFPQYVPTIIDTVDTNLHRLTTDGCRQYCAALPLDMECPIGCNCAREADRQSRFERVWTDLEKSIFLDKFLQFPKNFSKIASYLSNRTTQDCVKFYYDSKAAIGYKALLREVDNRRRQIRYNWQFSVPAANSVGCNLYPTGPLEATNDPLVELPLDDSTFNSFLNHPPYTSDKLEVEAPLSRRTKLMVYPLPEAQHATIVRAERRIDKFLSSSKNSKHQLKQPPSIGDYLFGNVRDNCPSVGEPSLLSIHKDMKRSAMASLMASHHSHSTDPRMAHTSTPMGKSGGAFKVGSTSKGGGGSSSSSTANGKSGSSVKMSGGGGSSKPGGIAEPFTTESNAAGKPRQRRRRRTPEEREREKELKQIRNAARVGTMTTVSAAKTDDERAAATTGSDGGNVAKSEGDEGRDSEGGADSDASDDDVEEPAVDTAEKIAVGADSGNNDGAMDVDVREGKEAPAEEVPTGSA